MYEWEQNDLTSSVSKVNYGPDMSEGHKLNMFERFVWAVPESKVGSGSTLGNLEGKANMCSLISMYNVTLITDG